MAGSPEKALDGLLGLCDGAFSWDRWPGGMCLGRGERAFLQWRLGLRRLDGVAQKGEGVPA